MRFRLVDNDFFILYRILSLYVANNNEEMAMWEADGSVSRKSVKHFYPGNRYKLRKSVSRKNS